MATRSLMICMCLAALAGLALGQIPGSFNHGIASGDPLPDRIILWTRVTPRPATVTFPGEESAYNPLLPPKNFRDNFPINVTWTVYNDSAASQVVCTGVFTTDIDRDWTVKVDVGNLTSRVQHYYNFKLAGGYASETGTFRLPPPAGQALDNLKYMVLGCSNWGWGYFNAYDAAARYDLDFWVHTGDYLYDYGVNNYPPPNQAVRYPGLEPEWDIETLDDFRKRHGTYRKDPGLQALTAVAPLIAYWDDHEFMNDVFTNGAENHYPGTINFYQRKFNAAKAYFEWIPIREPANFPTIYDAEPANFYAINRTFTFGDLAQAWVIEDRVTARTDGGNNNPNGTPGRPVSPATNITALVGSIPVSEWNQTVISRIQSFRETYNRLRTDPEKTQVGPQQTAWLARTTNQSVAAGIPWQLYFDGTVMMDRYSPDFEAAVRALNASGNAQQAALWAEALRNLTDPMLNATWTEYGVEPWRALNNSRSFPVTTALTTKYRGAIAAGRYSVAGGYDSWAGYLADRNRVLTAIKNANNPIVYSGDSHSFWTGYLKINDLQALVANNTLPGNQPAVAIEFGGGSVTSPGTHPGFVELPPEFVGAAYVTANTAAGMTYMNPQYHGGVFVNLTRTNQHVEYIYINTIGSLNYTAFCGAAFDVPARNSTAAPPRINPGKCGTVPAAVPYASRVVRAPNAAELAPLPVRADAIPATSAMVAAASV